MWNSHLGPPSKRLLLGQMPDAGPTSRAGTAYSWETLLTNEAQSRCDALCADILAYLFGRKLDSGVRKDLAKAVRDALIGRSVPYPRSLDEVAHLVRQVTSGETHVQAQIIWTPNIESGQVATLNWIAQEIKRDEFCVAWLRTDGLAQRTLRQWARATSQRIHDCEVEQEALTRKSIPCSPEPVAGI